MHYFPRLSLAALLAVALGAVATPRAGAGDEPTPAARFAAASAALPAPSDDLRLDFQGDLLMGGSRFGSVSFRATPTTRPDGTKAWSVEERAEAAGGAFQREAIAILDAHLQPLEGHATSRLPDEGDVESRWSRTPSGFSVETTRTRDGQTATTKAEHTHAGPVLTTLSSLWLFCRLTLPTAGAYETRFFDANPSEGEEALEAVTWSQGEEGRWGEVAAWLVKGRKGATDEMEAAFAKEDKAFLGARFLDTATGMAMEMRPAGPPVADTGEDPFAAPATSAQGAALAAALGFGTGDSDLLAAIIHWPSVHAALKARHDAQSTPGPGAPPFPDVDGLKAAILTEFAGLPKRPRAVIEPVLKACREQLRQEALEGGTVRVTFPPMFQDLTLDVGEVDGAWYLLRLP